MSMPVYIKIEECKDIMELMTLTQEKLQKARYLLEKMHDLKAQEDAALKQWADSLEQVEERLRSVDERFSDPGV